MRSVSALLLALALLQLLALPGARALAADWERYDNARFGYTIEIPPGLRWGPESENGDGRSFRDGATKLAVWGGNIVEDSFERAAQAGIGYAQGDGWAITYQAVAPDWASFSGTQGRRVLYQRMIALCDGQYAAFRLEYTNSEISRLDPVVNRLVRSLKGDC